MLFEGARFVLLSLTALALTACSDQWNTPYTAQQVSSNTLFSAFSAPPKHLDPVRSYSSNEWAINAQILEPPLQYHYLKRPYTLEPLTLSKMPEVRYLNQQGELVSATAKDMTYSEVILSIKPGIQYQPHPAFVKDEQGDLRYATLSAKDLSGLKSPFELKDQASRELVADDYAYAIKRMAVRQNHSPILDSMNEHIVGLKAFSEQISELRSKADNHEFFDLRSHQIDGVNVVNDHELRIRLHGIYPQFMYWLSMNFFAPVPWEVMQFYAQPGLVDLNISFDTFPVGTGPYRLVENNPNSRMRLQKHPQYQAQFYPSEGLADTMPASLLADAGKRLPMIDEVIYTLEKESVPYWNKFLQGYYDASGVSSDSFDQAVQVSVNGDLDLTGDMKTKGIQMRSSVQPTIFYLAFNMLDEVVGGYDEKAQKLRQAISIAVNYEEFISIFMNERGLAAQGPIPPGIFGHLEGQAGINPYVHEWHEGEAQRKSLETARQLLAEAGYPEGRNLETGRRLQLHYDAVATGPDDRSRMDWMRKQFEQLGIELMIRSTDYNRFQDKVRKGDAQIFFWGWNADYPDPENFLFLLYGPNSSVATNGAGINSSNYANPEFDRLFEQIRTMENTPERMEKLQEMLSIARQDAPWIWGLHPRSLSLYHSWYKNVWPNSLANNTVKYLAIDAEQRAQQQAQWNQPIVWPLWLIAGATLLLIIWAVWAYRQRQQQRVMTGDTAS
nr:ABC transporter substrate-binding protein [Thiomicrospira pelophila]